MRALLIVAACVSVIMCSRSKSDLDMVAGDMSGFEFTWGGEVKTEDARPSETSVGDVADAMESFEDVTVHDVQVTPDGEIKGEGVLTVDLLEAEAICVPSCGPAVCGPDGCGGECGQCGASEVCDQGVCMLPDSDGDGIPDVGDLFPADPNKPGVVLSSAVYAHTSSALYYMDVKVYTVIKVGDFKWPSGVSGEQMTDIGIDQYGQLFAVSFDNLYTCHPVTAECTLLGSLGSSSFNGLTLVPKGLIDPVKDVMVGISLDGGWYLLDIKAGSVNISKLGEYGGVYTSAGDAYSIEGVGTFAAVDKSGYNGCFLVTVDPVSGKATGQVAAIPNHDEIYGLAGWTDHAFAFDASGDIMMIDTVTGQVTVVNETGIAWWGAGVRTRID